MFIFNLNVVFTTYFSKMAPTRVQKRLQERISRGGICASVVRNNYVKKCAKFGQLTKPVAYFLPVKLSSLRGARSTPEQSSP
jgi:hypothetical protein